MDDDATLHLDDDNPWPGPAAYTEASQRFFYGREAETTELLRLIRLAPFVTLYGKSGLGKSSLLQAGLFPQLRAARFLPVYLRLDYTGTGVALLEQAALRLRQEIDAIGADAPAPDADESLWAYLQRRERPIWTADNFPLTPVLVFDQFEEVFSRSGSPAQVKVVLECMADLVGDRMSTALAEDRDAARRLNLQSQQYRVVLSFRSEFLADVESWEREANLPKRESFHLKALSRDAAIASVERAGAAVLDAGVATQIVDFVRNRDSDGIVGGISEVEPVLLSLCCYQLNSRRQRPAKIDSALLNSVGEDILEDFYRQSLADLRPDVSIFIEDNLIQGERYRSSYPVDEAEQSGALTTAELDTLIRRRLLRVDPQGDVPRVELIHDRIVGVVREARDRRVAREAHARQLQEAGERREADERMAEASRQRERALQAERERARVARWRNGLALSLLLLSIATGWLIYFASDASAQRKKADRDAETAVALASAAVAQAERAAHAEARAEEAATDARSAAAKTGFEAAIADRERRQAERERARARDAEERAVANGRRADALRLVVESDAILSGAIGATDPRADDTRAFQQILAALKLHSGADVDGAPFDALTARQHLLRFEPVVATDDSGVIAVAYSPDGRSIATGHADGTVALRPADAPQTVRARGHGHTALVQSIAFSHDGRRLLSASNDGSARQWSTADLAAVGEPLAGHAGTVYAAAYSNDDATIVTGGADGSVRLWDAQGGRPVHPPVAMESGVVWGVAYDPADRSIAVATGAPDNPDRGAGKASRLTLLDPKTLAVKAQLFAHAEETTSVAFSPDGSSIVTGGADDTLRRRDLTGDQSQSVRMVGHTDNVQSVAFSPDGRFIASASVDKTVRLWRASSGQPLGGPLTGHRAAATSVAFSPDARWIASAGDDGRLIVWALDPSWSPHAPAAAAAAADGIRTSIGAIAADGTADLFFSEGDLHHRDRRDALSDPGRALGPPLFECTAATATIEATPVARKGAERPARTRAPPAAYSADGRTLLWGGDDGSVHRWDTTAWRPVALPVAVSDCSIDAIATSADGRTVAAATGGLVLIVDTRGRTAPVRISLGDVRRDRALALSDDGRWMAVADGGPGRVARQTSPHVPGLALYDLRAPLAPPRRFERVPGPVASLAISPDHRYVVSGHVDGQMVVWLAATGAPITKPVKATTRGPVIGLAFLRDGRRLVSASGDGSTRPWPAPGAWNALMCEKVAANLSRAHWKAWVSRDVPYRCTCPGLPIPPDDGVAGRPEMCAAR